MALAMSTADLVRYFRTTLRNAREAMSIRSDLDRDGFALVAGVLTPTEIDDLGRAFDGLVDVARTLSGTTEVSGSQVVMQPDPFVLQRVVWCGGLSPVLAKYGHDPRILGLAFQALASHRLTQIIQQAHFKLPGDGLDFSLHQDASNRRYGTDLWTDVDGRGSFVQIAIPIDPMGPENGGLQLVPGSHKLGFIADPATGALPEGAVDLGRVITPRVRPGDVLLFGPFTIHGSGPNRSDRSRRLFIQGYALPGANHRIYHGCGTGVERTV